MVANDVTSYTISAIPFFRSSDGNRLQYASNHAKQALPLFLSEPPLLITPHYFYLSYIKTSAFVFTAPMDLTILDILDNQLIYQDQRSGKISVLSTPYTHKIHVLPGMSVEMGDIISSHPSFQNNIICQGRNADVIFNYYDGFTYEDGIVLDESVKEDFRAYRTTYVPLTKDKTFLYKVLELKQPIAPGTTLQPGVIATFSESKLFPQLHEQETIDVPFLVKYVYTRIPNNSDAKKTMKLQFDSVREWLERYEVTRQLQGRGLDSHCKKLISHNLKSLFHDTKSIEIMLIGDFIYEVKVGDKFTNRHGNKGIISRIEKIDSVKLGELTFQPQVCFNPEGIRRMNLGQLGEMHYAFLLKHVVPVAIKQMEKTTSTEDVLNKILDTFVKPISPVTYKLTKSIYAEQDPKDTIEYIKRNGLITVIGNEEKHRYLHEILKLNKTIRDVTGLPDLIPLKNKLCGYGTMYIHRLYHTVDSKTTFENQRIGEQEMWSLMQTCPIFLQELFVRSDSWGNLEKFIADLFYSRNLSEIDIHSYSQKPLVIDELRSLLFALNITNIDYLKISGDDNGDVSATES